MVAGRVVLSIVLLWSLTSCRGAMPPPAAPGAAAPAVEPASVRWVRDSAEYRAALRQAYAAATSAVASAAAERATGRWAVVLDADETVISNLQYQVERARAGLGFTPESWNEWVRRRAAEPLPGAGAFLSRVRDLGGRVAVVTNRLQSECADTAAVFEAHGLVYDVMLCRPNGAPSDKAPRFDAVARGTTPMGGPPLEVVAFVGDNILDFPGLTQAAGADPASLDGFGTRFFLVPNPMYGSWE
jgi:5'-nucleotidase (lipoprotein e(P4) family)